MKMVKGILVSAVMASVTGVAFADDDDKTAFQKVEGELSVMVLGSGGPIATPAGRASAGYLIFTDGKPRILMDVGGGTFQRLAESGTNIKDLDTILLSHLHADHTGDLTSVMKTVYFHNNLARNKARAMGVPEDMLPPGRTDPINIYGPASSPLPATAPGVRYGAGAGPLVYPSTVDYVDGHYSIPGGGVERYLKAFVFAISDEDGPAPFGGPKAAVSAFDYTATDLSADWRPMVGGTPNPASRPQVIIDAADGLKVTSLAVNHGPVPAVAFRIEYKGHSIVYTGDTSSKIPTNPADVDAFIVDFKLKNLVTGADLLIYDAAITDTLPTNPLFKVLHTAPYVMGQIVAGSGVKKLVLSHITPVTETRLNEVEAVVEAAGFSGEIKDAEDLKVYNLGDDD